jgi:hypothetical protein
MARDLGRWSGVAITVAVFGGGFFVRRASHPTEAYPEAGAPLPSTEIPPEPPVGPAVLAEPAPGEGPVSSQEPAPAGGPVSSQAPDTPGSVAPASVPRGLYFVDVAEKTGIRFVYKDPLLHPRFQGKERLFFWGSGAGVTDLDRDGFPDILLVTPRKGEAHHLCLSRGGRRFEERAASWGVAETPDLAATAPVFFDMDNDGDADLFLAGIGCTHLFRNTGSRFEDVSVAAGLRDCETSLGAVPLDVDRDGLLDLYVLRNWGPVDLADPKTSRIWPENHYDAKNGGKNTLYRNTGRGTFTDVTAELGGGDPHWTLDAVWADLGGQGSYGLYVANDFGADTLYSNTSASLADASERLGTPDRRFGMGVSLGDLHGDGAPAVFVTNEFLPGYEQTGNFLRRVPPRGDVTDEAPAWGAHDCGWAWGSLFADFDMDGRQDLYVANGFISGPSSAEDRTATYYGALRQDYAFVAGTLMAAPGAFSTSFDRWPAIGTFSYAGHQNDCLFLNEGRRFANVATRVGLVEDGDGRAVVGIDHDNNGSMDLLVTTQNGPPRLYQNRVAPGRRWIGFSLQGTRSNRDAAGARVEVRQGDRVFYRWATAGRTGFLASSDPRLLFGLPLEGPVDVSVRWPTGHVQELKRVEPGRYHRVVEQAP